MAQALSQHSKTNRLQARSIECIKLNEVFLIKGIVAF